MAEMPEDLIALLKAWHSVPVATTGADGTPNVAPKSVVVRDPRTIVWGELYFMQTYPNLLRRPAASIAVWWTAPPFTAYRVNGRTEIHEHDEVSEALDRSVWTGHGDEFEVRTKKMVAVVLKVESVWDQTPRPESADVRVR